jgi:hypothetical protein
MTSLTIHDVDTELILKLKDAASRLHETQDIDKRYYLFFEIRINDMDLWLFSSHYEQSLADIHNIKKSYREDS